MALACMALFAGCPTAGDDARTSRGAEGDPSTIAELQADKFCCTNYRPWRADLDVPEYLNADMKGEGIDERENPDLGTGREERKKRYIAAHEGTYTVCHQPLVDVDLNANRGSCKVCTEMLTSPAWIDKRVSHERCPTGNGPVYAADDPIQLLPEQQFVTKIEFRLVWKKEDHLTKSDEQIASYKEYLATRNPGPVILGWDTSKNPPEPNLVTEKGAVIEEYVKRAKARSGVDRNNLKAYGMLTVDDAVPLTIPKFGLPPLAEPYIACPRCTKPVNPTESRCWNCNTFYTLSHRDERNAISEPHESLCPSCNQAVDPTLGWCDNPTCKKCPTHGANAKFNKGPDGDYVCSQCGSKSGGTFHRAQDREGPCWRCGGSHVCPECLGSGKGQGMKSTGQDGNPLETDCWLCCGKGTQTAPGFNGTCPECDSRGFTIYDGALPAGFKGEKRDLKKDWRLRAGQGGAKKAGGEGGGDKGGDKPEKPEKEKPAGEGEKAPEEPK